MVKYEITRARPGTIVETFTLEFTGDGDIPFEIADQVLSAMKDLTYEEIEDKCGEGSGVIFEPQGSVYLAGPNSLSWRQSY